MEKGWRLNILFLEPFFGGSHEVFANGFKTAMEAATDHAVTLATLPDRFWKWRMRGASLAFAEQVTDFSAYDLIVTTDMLDLADLIALGGRDLPPTWLYFHENQLDYPLAEGEKRDFHLGFTNIVSALAADRVFFNSRYHMDAFFNAADKLIRKLPDFQPQGAIKAIMAKAEIIYPGCRFERQNPHRAVEQKEGPLIVWNHRWEHDKNPELFFKGLEHLKQKKIPFSLAILGERYSKSPEVFDRAQETFDRELAAYGYQESRDDYIDWLCKADIVVSCAIQENFGISVVEAIGHGCVPLLPNRLSYPELIPADLHDLLLYQDETLFFNMLEKMTAAFDRYKGLSDRLSSLMAAYEWSNIIEQFIDRLPGGRPAEDQNTKDP